jgi:hypothetical protein
VTTAFTDPFDALLISTADVLTRDASPAGSSGDAYGLSDPAFTTVDTGVPCRVSSNPVGTDKEMMARMKEDIAYKKVFMRPWYDPNNRNPLSHDHWLRIYGYDTSSLYDIFEIRDPGGMGHHLEIDCRLVEP